MLKINLIALVICAAALTPAHADDWWESHTNTNSNSNSITHGSSTSTTTHSGNSTTTNTTEQRHTQGQSHSSSNTFGLGVSNGARDDRPQSDYAPWNRGPDYATLAGDWQIAGRDGGKSCTLTLNAQPLGPDYGARTGIGCPDGLFSVASWKLYGDEIRLLSPGGTVRPGSPRTATGASKARPPRARTS